MSRLLVPIEAWEVKRRRELEIERIRLEAEKHDLDGRCRAYFSNNPVPHDPSLLMLREMGLPDLNPVRTELEEALNRWQTRWNATLSELANLLP
jgi:hypothetical protein